MARSTSGLMFAVPLVLAGALLAAILWWPFEVNASYLQQTLIQAGVDPDDLNKADKYGDTALMGATLYGHVEIVQLLEAAGAREIKIPVSRLSGCVLLLRFCLCCW